MCVCAFLQREAKELYWEAQCVLYAPHRKEDELRNAGGSWEDRASSLLAEQFVQQSDDPASQLLEFVRHKMPPTMVLRLARSLIADPENAFDEEAFAELLPEIARMRQQLDAPQDVPWEDLHVDTDDCEEQAEAGSRINLREVLVQWKNGAPAAELLQQLKARIDGDQLQAWQLLEQTVDSQEQQFLLVQAAAGCGKTFLAVALQLYAQTQHRVVTPLAASNRAALTVGGKTLHSYFGIKVQVARRPTLSSRHRSSKGQGIAHAQLRGNRE